MVIDLSSRLTLTVDEAISTLGVGRTMLYELLSDGSIRSIKIGKKRLVIIESIREWIIDMESYGIGNLSSKQ